MASLEQVNLKVQLTPHEQMCLLSPHINVALKRRNRNTSFLFFSGLPPTSALTSPAVSTWAHFFIREPSHNWHPASCFMVVTTKPLERKQKDRWASASPSHLRLCQKPTKRRCQTLFVSWVPFSVSGLLYVLWCDCRNRSVPFATIWHITLSFRICRRTAR